MLRKIRRKECEKCQFVTILYCAWDDTITEDAIAAGANLWREVVVDENYGPDRVLAMIEIGDTIKRDAEGNVTRVGEVFPALGLAIDYDLLFEEILIDRRVKYIPDGAVAVTSTGTSVVVSILELFCNGLVLEHHLELSFHG